MSSQAALFPAALRALKPQGIGKRLLFFIVLGSSLVTLVATGLQLYTDYQRDVSNIRTRLHDIEGSYLGSIHASLWNLDIQQLNLQLEGIHQLPDIEYVAVSENPESVADPLELHRGKPAKNNALTRHYPIIRQLPAGHRQIGTLTVQASLSEVYQRLREKVVVILLTQGVKTFLVSLFILYIVHRLVTGHLTRISQRMSEFKLTESQPPLWLERTSPKQPDELDQVVSAFNALSLNLRQAYVQLHQINSAQAKDIIARREAEEEVKHLNQVLEERVFQRTAELEAANQELASFCYSVSHDLRAPLRRIEGFSRLLNDTAQGSLDEKSRHYLQRIGAGSREMAEMIDSFLRLSRATQGELHVEIVDLSAAVHQLYCDYRERDPKRKVTLDLHDNARAPADRHLFNMLLSNLFDNAWKYSSRVEHAEISFGFEEVDGERVYYMSDNGDGFDMQYADRLFAPFSRLHNSENFEGVGIGLATVQRIIHRHGGRIWAKSSPGAGTTFYFILWERNTDREQGNYIASRG